MSFRVDGRVTRVGCASWSTCRPHRACACRRGGLAALSTYTDLERRSSAPSSTSSTSPPRHLTAEIGAARCTMLVCRSGR